MSSARFGRKWADVDEEDDDEGVVDASGKSTGTRFETPVDEHGIKTVIEYTEREGKTYKVSKKVKETKISSWTNKAIMARKSMPKFGKAALNDESAEKMLVVRSTEEVSIELTKKINMAATVKDDADDKFYEESLALAESLTKEKKKWTDVMNEKRAGGDDAPVGVGAGNSVRDAMNDGKEVAKFSPLAGAADSKGGTKYVPPSLRGGGDGGKGDGKGGKGGKGDFAAQQEASLRVTNLSEDCKEGDLQDLFAQCGRLQRVYLAKDMETFQSRGFAFITYYTKEDAQRAINKLHGHGYDNLILSVQFAKPRA